ncbi:TPA: MCE family protein [bacterium]|nr:MCE family protein [bacterium]
MKARGLQNEVKVGIMMLIGLILLVILILRASHWQPTSNMNEIRIRFDNVGGLLRNAPVSMHGMEIGKVKSIELMGNWVQVTVNIDKNIQIKDGYRILIDIIGIVGEKYIEIVNGPPTNMATKDDPLMGISPPSIGNLLIEAKNVAQKAEETLIVAKGIIDANKGDVKTSIDDIRKFIVTTSETMERTLQNLDIMMTRINRLTEFKEGDIAKTITEVKTLVTELNNDRERISPIVNSFIKNLDKISSDTSLTLGSSLDNLKKSSEDIRTLTEKLDKNVVDLTESVSKIVGKLDNTTDDSSKKIQSTLVDLGRASALMNNILDRADYIVTEVEKGNGTVGKLIKSDEGYNQINEVMAVSKKALDNVDKTFANVNQAVTDFNKATKDLNSWRLQLFGDVSSVGEYELSYNHLSGTLQNQLRLSVLPSMPYTYIGGIFMKGDAIKYDLQAGRRFGNLTVRGGFIRSIAGLGLDYWVIPDRLILSVEGVNITTKEPEIGIDASIRMFNNWYLMFGADAINVNKSGLSAGVRAIYK